MRQGTSLAVQWLRPCTLNEGGTGLILGQGIKTLKSLGEASFFFFFLMGTSLVAQWIRICLPMKGAWVQSLVGEDPTCCRATKPVCHNY